MNNTKSKAGLVILPNNCATHSTCALCGSSDRMAIPFDSFTHEGRWACGHCAQHEWGPEVVRLLQGLNAPMPSDRELALESDPKQRAWVLACTEYAFDAERKPLAGGVLVQLAVRDGLSPTLAKLITDELLRRFGERSPDLQF